MEIKDLSLEMLDFPYQKLRSRSLFQEKRLLVSLEESGQQSPLIVVRTRETGRYTVIDGHKRIRALRKLKADVVKAVLWEAKPPEALVLAYQIKSGSGYSALEEAWLVYELCRGSGWTLSEAAKALDKNKSWISRRLGLAESLPEAVLDGVQKGQIGAYAAMKYLLPLARANAKDCEALAKIITEHTLTSRQVEILYHHYTQGPKAIVQKIMENPILFLKAKEQAAKGTQDHELTPLENRCLNNLKIAGNISLGLVRSLPEACGYDATAPAKAKLCQGWEGARERWRLLEKTATSLFSQEPIHA